ncbi:MAG: TonB-dependent receptor [Lysobacteraceae bacterium]
MHQLTKGIPRRRNTSSIGRLPLAAAIYLAISSAAFAQADNPAPPADQSTGAQASEQKKPAQPERVANLGEITVTAQKRKENLQKVPISILAISDTKLKQADVLSFQDYAKMIPSLSYGTAGGGVFSGPGFVQVYMRGIASGGDGNHSGSQPSVGMYLDEQPITTIEGALDIHMYDIERVEALAGPQGTLYGASSESGTVRIITKKPDPAKFESSYAVEVNAIEGGGIGHVVEGMVNVPISPSTAIRLVGWEKHDAGYVDNVHGTITFPTSGITVDNSNRVKNNYNDSNTVGARAALKIDLNDNWTISPTIMGQHQQSYGSTGFDPKIGDLKVVHFTPESSDDSWAQAALTVEGKIGNFDLTYVFSHLKRTVDSHADYTDYAFWYDTLAGYGAYFYDNSGALINPTQYIHGKDGYTKTSHELRITSPATDRLRFVGGLFWQQQQHNIFQDYQVTDLADVLQVPGYPDTIWLTQQQRRDKDEAVFGELSFDLTNKLTFTGGLRYFRTNNSLKGFFGYGPNFAFANQFNSVLGCTPGKQFTGAPCLNLDKDTSQSGTIGRFNATYKIDDNKLIYATWSEGFRPGGINRRGTVPPYKPDFLTNYEFGWKTSWLENRLHWNGAIFREEWKDFQFSYLGANGLTEIRNANQARVDGFESELNWAATYNLSINGSMAFYNARLTDNYCALAPNGILDPTCFDSLIANPGKPDFAAKGTRLPITPRFKGNLNARYSFDMAGGDAYWQATLTHVGSRSTDLRELQGERLGGLAAYTLLDLSAGYSKNGWSLDFFLKNATNERAQLAKFSECAAQVCGYQPYTVTAPPRTFGVRFSQDF